VNGKCLRGSQYFLGVAGAEIYFSALFIHAIRSIHKAGVLHHDIRPENLLITEDGREATIIDFDRATFDPSAHDKHMERTEVQDLVDGNYTFDAGGHYETPQSYVPSPSPASSSRRTRERSTSNLSDISEASTVRGSRGDTSGVETE